MADSNAMYVAHRDVRVASVFGHVLWFKKGVPMSVPMSMREQVQQCGILPVNGEAAYTEDVVKKAPLTGRTRKDKIRETIAEMILEKDAANNFTATGLPNAKVIEKRVGFQIDSKERNVVWKEMQKDGALR